MALTNEERHALSLIEGELRRQDPLLAQHLENAPTADLRRRRFQLARRLMAVGGAVVMIGLIASDGAISLGALLGAYGCVVVVVGAVMAALNYTRPVFRRKAFWQV